jgi:hypothetical protein
MSATTPVDRVADFLAKEGFRSLPVPLEIAGLKFDFPFAFVGSAPSPDLILVADTAFDNEQRITKKVEAVGRALDVVQSKRPLTVVIAGPRPNTSAIEAMSKVCRVLPIGTVSDEDPDAVLRNWLAVLTPLHLPEPSAGIGVPLNEVATALEDLHPSMGDLVELAPRGAEAVQSRLHEIIAEPFDNDIDDDTP